MGQGATANFDEFFERQRTQIKKSTIALQDSFKGSLVYKSDLDGLDVIISGKNDLDGIINAESKAELLKDETYKQMDEDIQNRQIVALVGGELLQFVVSFLPKKWPWSQKHTFALMPDEWYAQLIDKNIFRRGVSVTQNLSVIRDAIGRIRIDHKHAEAAKKEAYETFCDIFAPYLNSIEALSALEYQMKHKVTLKMIDRTQTYNKELAVKSKKK